MARKTEGYRARRLAERRSERSRTYQNVVLYVLAGVIAFGAVLGGVRLAHALRAKHVRPADSGYLALVTVGVGEKGRQPVAALLVHDANDGGLILYTIPRDLLLSGPHGEYVMASDALTRGEIRPYLERLVKGKVSYVLRLSYADLVRLSGGDTLHVTTATPFGLQLGGATHTYPRSFRLPTALLPAVLSADGQKGTDQANAQQAFLSAALAGAGLAPADRRAAAVAAVAKGQRSQSDQDSRDLLGALLSDRTSVQRLPSWGQVAEGQFAWRPDSNAITARITRNARGFDAPYTVVVENGSGAIGVGQMVIDRLAGMDVNLPPVKNADSFGYGTTQILAGAKAFGVASDVRGILRRGAVLKGSGLPDTTVVVIVGKDLTAKDLQ